MLSSRFTECSSLLMSVSAVARAMRKRNHNRAHFATRLCSHGGGLALCATPCWRYGLLRWPNRLDERNQCHVGSSSATEINLRLTGRKQVAMEGKHPNGN